MFFHGESVADQFDLQLFALAGVGGDHGVNDGGVVFENGARGVDVVEDGIAGHFLRADGDDEKRNVAQGGGALAGIAGGVVAAVGDHDDGVHGLFGGFLGGAVEGGGQIGGTGGRVVAGAQDLAPIVARQGQNIGRKGVALDAGMIGHVLEPGVFRVVQPAGHLVIA